MANRYEQRRVPCSALAADGSYRTIEMPMTVVAEGGVPDVLIESDA